MALIHLDISIKFRALGITFGNWHDVISFPLPSVLTVVGLLMQPHDIGTYNDHGVKIVASVIKP